MSIFSFLSAVVFAFGEQFIQDFMKWLTANKECSPNG